VPLGVACHWLVPKTKRDGAIEWVNGMGERLLQLGRWRDGLYTEEQVAAVLQGNVESLERMAHTISRKTRLFRLSSNILPLMDIVPRYLWDTPEVRGPLARAGKIFQDAGTRIVSHPGQFCVLSSDSDAIVANAVRELVSHAWVFDAMGLPQTPHAAINIHGGKRDRTARLIESIRELPWGVRSRLTLENDESAYGVVDLLPVSESTGVPIVWDSHHWTFKTGGLTIDEAYRLSCETWTDGIRPLQHVSNSPPGPEGRSFMELRKHSQYLDFIPDPQLQGVYDDLLDLEVEAKMKNLAVDQIRKKYSINDLRPVHSSTSRGTMNP